MLTADLTAGRGNDQAAKGSSSVEIILYSNFGTVIKSVKIVEGRMVQVSHTGGYSQCLPLSRVSHSSLKSA